MVQSGPTVPPPNSGIHSQPGIAVELFVTLPTGEEVPNGGGGEAGRRSLLSAVYPSCFILASNSEAHGAEEATQSYCSASRL